jgi:MFS family permease
LGRRVSPDLFFIRVSGMSEKTKTLVLVSLAGLLSMAVSFNYSAVMPILIKEWGFSARMSGSINGVFLVGYIISVLATGWLADRLGGRRVFVWSALETGMFGMAFILFARGYHSALFFRFMMGLGQGGLYVPSMRLLSDWYAPEERGKALGTLTGVLIATYAIPYLSAPLAAATSWRWAMTATTLPAFAGAAVMHFLVKEKPEASGGWDAPDELYSAQKEGPGLLRGVLLNKKWWLINGGYMGHSWELFAMYGWIGYFLTASGEASGKSSADALSWGGLVGGLSIFVGTISCIMAGTLSDKYDRFKVMTLFLVISMACSFIYGRLLGGSSYLLVMVGLIYGFSVVADSAIYKAATTETVPARHIGTALGLQSFLGFGAGALSQPVFGAVLDGAGWVAAWTSSGLAAMAGLVCLFALRWQRK